MIDRRLPWATIAIFEVRLLYQDTTTATARRLCHQKPLSRLLQLNCQDGSDGGSRATNQKPSVGQPTYPQNAPLYSVGPGPAQCDGRLQPGIDSLARLRVNPINFHHRARERRVASARPSEVSACVDATIPRRHGPAGQAKPGELVRFGPSGPIPNSR